MAFEVLHKHDISLDGQEMRNQMIENFEAIEHEDQQDDARLTQEIHDRKDADSRLQDQIDKINIHLDDLDKTKATHDEVQAAEDEWKKKIEHVALGTDYETVEQAVMQILKEKGLV